MRAAIHPCRRPFSDGKFRIHFSSLRILWMLEFAWDQTVFTRSPPMCCVSTPCWLHWRSTISRVRPYSVWFKTARFDICDTPANCELWSSSPFCSRWKETAAQRKTPSSWGSPAKTGDSPLMDVNVVDTTEGIPSGVRLQLIDNWSLWKDAH